MMLYKLSPSETLGWHPPILKDSGKLTKSGIHHFYFVLTCFNPVAVHGKINLAP